MNKKRNLLLGVILAMGLLVSCQEEKLQKEEKAYSIKGDTVKLHSDSYLRSKIILSKVKEKPFSREVISAGTIQPIPTKIAYVAPPLSGRVTKSHITIGQRVSKGTPLFEVFSSEFTTVQKEFFQAKSERDLAFKDKKRKEDLVSNGVGSKKDLEEALNVYFVAEQEYENCIAAIRFYEVDPENMILGQPLVIYSPIDGKIIENNIVVGQHIKDDSDPVAVVADISQVWITAQVKEKDIRFIQKDDEMNIFVSALPDKAIKGKVFYIEDSIDEDTRAIKVLAVCDNEDALLKLGMYCSVRFTDSPVESIVVPETALLQDEKNSFVFVQKSENVFVKKVVEAEFSVAGEAIVSSGLNRGDIVISQGGYYFK